MRDLILGGIVLALAWGAILFMIASALRQAANDRIEEERLKMKAELIRRANRIGEVRAREILKQSRFTVRIVPVNESDIKWVK